MGMRLRIVGGVANRGVWSMISGKPTAVEEQQLPGGNAGGAMLVEGTRSNARPGTMRGIVGYSGHTDVC
ncbi:MAG: hypothetical protein ACRD0Z_15380 [Acidimicrobiales bacterium]